MKLDPEVAEKIVGFAESIAEGNLDDEVVDLRQEQKDPFASRLLKALVQILRTRQERENELKETIERLNDVCQKMEVIHQSAENKVQARVKSLEKANELLKTLSVTDGLTNLNNRRNFENQLRREVTRTERYKEPLSVIMLDIDHFKKVNDTFGHQLGDVVLRKLGYLIRSSLRTHDFPARYGGEEFVILLMNTPGEKAMVVAEKLRHAVEKLAIEENGHTIQFTISLGVSQWDPATMKSPKDLVKAADDSLLEAKRTGRNRTVYYNGPEDKQ